QPARRSFALADYVVRSPPQGQPLPCPTLLPVAVRRGRSPRLARTQLGGAPRCPDGCRVAPARHLSTCTPLSAAPPDRSLALSRLPPARPQGAPPPRPPVVEPATCPDLCP